MSCSAGILSFAKGKSLILHWKIRTKLHLQLLNPPEAHSTVRIFTSSPGAKVAHPKLNGHWTLIPERTFIYSRGNHWETTSPLCNFLRSRTRSCDARKMQLPRQHWKNYTVQFNRYTKKLGPKRIQPESSSPCPYARKKHVRTCTEQRYPACAWKTGKFQVARWSRGKTNGCRQHVYTPRRNKRRGLGQFHRFLLRRIPVSLGFLFLSGLCFV